MDVSPELQTHISSGSSTGPLGWGVSRVIFHKPLNALTSISPLHCHPAHTKMLFLFHFSKWKLFLQLLRPKSWYYPWFLSFSHIPHLVHKATQLTWSSKEIQEPAHSSSFPSLLPSSLFWWVKIMGPPNTQVLIPGISECYKMWLN